MSETAERTGLQVVKRDRGRDADANGTGPQPHFKKGNAGERAAQLVADLAVWLDPDSTPWVTLVFEDHQEHWPVRSSTVKRHITAAFFATYRTGISQNTLRDVVNLLEGRAQAEGRRHPVGLRLAEYDGAIYLDLCDERWARRQDHREGLGRSRHAARALSPCPRDADVADAR
jgi:hypothetical protein